MNASYTECRTDPDPAGGNPAGVVLDASQLTERDMQRVAAEVGYSETAFVTGPIQGEGAAVIPVRYFAPEGEVDFCGHATIATAAAIGQLAGAGIFTLQTKVGPKKKPSMAIDELCQDDDPWLILSAGSAGVLAAWDDRLAIVKTGGMAGIMAGAMMGGRTAVYHFTDITGIEYNSGMLNGVLEVLTPSYSGAANKDFWRGTASGRNADANDPWTLSNTLPLDKFSYRNALPQINELRSRISRAKQPIVTIKSDGPAPTAVPGLAEELVKLAALHDAGVLSDAEFAAAKASLLT
jgi:hypothetical protein